MARNREVFEGEDGVRPFRLGIYRAAGGSMIYFSFWLFFFILPFLALPAVWKEKRLRSGRHVSLILIPVIGPAFGTAGVVVTNSSPWLIPVLWLTDLSTVAFAFALPRILSEWWATSRFTRTDFLQGERGNRRAILTLHRGGVYYLQLDWKRNPGEQGIVQLGDVGAFTRELNCLELVSHTGKRIILYERGKDGFFVESDTADTADEQRSSEEKHSVAGWVLKSQTADLRRAIRRWR